MTWINENRVLVKDIRAYVSRFDKQKPNVFELFREGHTPVFDFSIQSGDGLKILLLYSALNQDISEEELCRFICQLYKKCGQDIFSLNQLPFHDLQEMILESLSFKGWKIIPKIPGILRSACDFFLEYPSIEALLHQVGNSEELVRIISAEIFFMGKASLMKYKARSFAMFIMKGYKKIDRDFWNRDSLLPITSGANRFMYFIGPLKHQKGKEFTGERKLLYFNRFFNELYPAASWRDKTGKEM